MWWTWPCPSWKCGARGNYINPNVRTALALLVAAAGRLRAILSWCFKIISRFMRFKDNFSPSLVHCSRTSAPTSFSCWWVTPRWGRWWWPGGDLPGSRLLIGKWGPFLFGWGNSHPNLAHLWDADNIDIRHLEKAVFATVLTTFTKSKFKTAYFFAFGSSVQHSVPLFRESAHNDASN